MTVDNPAGLSTVMVTIVGFDCWLFHIRVETEDRCLILKQALTVDEFSAKAFAAFAISSPLNPAIDLVFGDEGFQSDRLVVEPAGFGLSRIAIFNFDDEGEPPALDMVIETRRLMRTLHDAVRDFDLERFTRDFLPRFFGELR